MCVLPSKKRPSRRSNVRVCVLLPSYRSATNNRGADYMLSLKVDSTERRLAIDEVNGLTASPRARGVSDGYSSW